MQKEKPTVKAKTPVRYPQAYLFDNCNITLKPFSIFERIKQCTTLLFGGTVSGVKLVCSRNLIEQAIRALNVPITDSKNKS